MKLFKRFAAALLVGAMVLAMLTACGGGAASAAKTDEQKAEDAYMAVLNGVFGTNQKNNATLEAAAKNYLNSNLENDGSLKDGGSLVAPLSNNMDKDGNVSIVMIMTDNAGKPNGLTSEDLAKYNDASAVESEVNATKKTFAALLKQQNSELSDEAIDEALKKMGDSIVAMGAGSLKKSDKIYTAVAVTLPASALGGGSSNGEQGQ